MPGLIDPNRELLDRATPLVYKQVGDQELKVHVFQPEDSSEGLRPAMLFFFGSFWDQGSISQFAPQCAYYASRGVVAGAVEYRVGSTHGTGPVDAVADARAAFQWMRTNAEKLRIDPNRIVGGGASGGAYLLFASTMIDDGSPDDQEPAEPTVSSHPDAIVAFSPILDISKRGAGLEHFENPKIAKVLSPLALVRRDLPPSIIFHGTSDRLVPFAGADKFARRMRRKKNHCELISFEGQEHSFFNLNVNMAHYEATLNHTDRFLAEVGILDADSDSGEALVGF